MKTNISVRVFNNSKPEAFVVVSKKTLNKAVDRNKIKRRIISSARKHLQKNKKYIFYPRASSLKLKFTELDSEIASLINLK